MRHRVKGKKLGRNTGQRKALRLSLARELLLKERIKTTRAKADYIRGHVEKLITVAKRGIAKSQELDNEAVKVHAMRVAGSRLNNDRALVHKLFDELAPRYETRPGGYTRIYKLGPRKGDNAEMVLIELVDSEFEQGV